MDLSIPTPFLMMVLACAVMALAMLAMSWGTRHKGLKLWASGLGMAAFAAVFLGLHGAISDAVCVVLGYGLASLSLCYLLAAVLHFQGRALRWSLLLLPAPLLSVAVLLLMESYALRLTAVSLTVAVQLVFVVHALCAPEQGAPGRGKLLVTLGVALAVLVALLRATTGVAMALQDSMPLPYDALDAWTFLVIFAVLLFVSIGYVFMTKERADETSQRLAAVDELTGLANRRSIIAALNRDVGRAIRSHECMAVLMVDIDHFKHLNDTYGPLAGDKVLRNVADAIQNRIRTQDIVGRYGGEEFLVVAADTSIQGARQLAEQLRSAVQETWCAYAGETLCVTVSVGVFGGRLAYGDSWDQLIHAADMALYRAKQGGRNRVELAERLNRVAHKGSTHVGPETYPSSLM